MHGQSFLLIISLSTLVNIVRVPKAYASCEYLPIDTNFVSIPLLVSVHFCGPLIFSIGGRGGIKIASSSTPSVNEPIRASF